MEMNEQGLLDLIKTGGTVVVKVWMDNCPKCDEFKPIFQKVADSKIIGADVPMVSFNLPARPDPATGSSVFKKEYMKSENGKPIGAPAVMVFNEGKLLYRHYGKMSEKDLIEFITKGTPPVDQKAEAKQELIMLFARRGELSMLLEELPHLDAKINQIKQFLGAP